MSSLLRIFVCCVLIISASAVHERESQIVEETPGDEDGAKVENVRESKRPSCIISIPEDEADGLTKLLNGFLNVFTQRPEPATADASSNAGSAFVLNCDNGISGLETSVWRILNRVWLATSCQYSEQEFDQALLEVEREADKVLITLKNVDVVPFNGRIKTDYYHSTVATIKTTLVQAVEKTKEVQKSGRCHSSAVKQLTANFEEALREIKSQKETIAVLQDETRQALSDMKTLKAQTEKSLLAVTAQKIETEMLFQIVTGEKNDTESALAKIIPAIQAVESQGKQVGELRAVFDNQTSMTEGKFGVVEETLKTYESEFVGIKANLSQLVTEQTEKNSGQDELLEKLNAKVFHLELKTTGAPLREETSTTAPPTALQVYRSSGLAGLTGKPLNIENEHYKGEFLYLARNPNDRTANVNWDGATLAVGGDKLRESAFQWEFVRVPGEASSVFYLRNKLNKLKPIPSKQDDSSSLRNYIRIETVSFGTGGDPSQLVITMKETISDKYYYHPWLTPNTTSALNGREIWSNGSPSYPGTIWIATLAS